ncbi:MAG: SDR family NAD(P)-dependent oxidoreductase [Marinosulfonomonas sp.]|nr:SDR family NAD(P)-dependent oxidoreductase [Marinosulfonomonas sp.]
MPAAENVSDVWKILLDGRCVISTLPAERWSAERFKNPDRNSRGKTYVNRAGLVDNVYDFDSGFFELTPRECEQIDPQQRILLETVALAFDHAGIDTAALDKDRTGVFVGAASSDHSTTAIQDLSLMDAQYMLGNTLSIIANRISYHWDLKGPSYTVDTACSSGLFALDQARQAIERGDIDTAIVGSVNLLLSPLPFVGFAQASMLSEKGLCHSFGKDGDGYVRAEGAVVFILRRGDLAQKSEDFIRSWLVATATNSDGRTPGIALPSSAAQQALMERTKTEFDIDPNDLAFVEAHGTGTAVGDPLEAQAIGQAYGQARETVLPIGSAKSNFGHLEPASGLLGLLKAQLALEHGMIPPSLHAREVNPNIPFGKLQIEVVQEATPVLTRDKPWLAAVNSFGFGGGNAHAVLQQVRPLSTGQAEFAPALRISAESPEALRALAMRWRDLAVARQESLAQKMANANTRLTRHRERLCVVAGSAESLTENLDSWLADGAGRTAGQGIARVDRAKIGFVFSGNGSQWAGMGRHMLRSDPVFRKSFEATNAIFVDLGSESVIDMLMSSDLGLRLDRAPVAQPLLLAIQIGLVDALANQGLVPQAVLGHSAGELAAAYAAGAITRKTAVKGIYARSRTMDELFERGAMAALVCSRENAEEMIAAAGLAVDIAAENTGESLTVSGKKEDLKSLLKLARKQRIVGKILAIEYPYHSRFVDPLKKRLDEELKDLNGVETPITIYSGCLGEPVRGDQLTSEYWWSNARDMVRFREGVQAMARDGVSLFLEISPKSVLRTYIRDCLEEIGARGDVLGSLEENRDAECDARGIALNALAHGGEMDEAVLLGPDLPFRGGLPDYPFTRGTYQLRSNRSLDIFGRGVQHSLLGGRVSPDADVWTGDLSLGRLPWLGGHAVGGKVILPATGILEIFVEAAAQLAGCDAVELRDLEILRPVHLGPNDLVQTRVRFDSAARRLSLETKVTSDWQVVAIAAVFEISARQPEPIELAEGDAAEGLYPALAAKSLDYGPAFARVDKLAGDGDRIDARFSDAEVELPAFRIDPTLMDAGLHSVLPLLAGRGLRDDVVFVPARIGRTRVFGVGPIVGSRLTLHSASNSGVCFDITYVDGTGEVVLTVEELRLRPMPLGSRQQTQYWDERLVPAAATGGRNLAAILQELKRPDAADPTDLEVIREAIGGRLAWDVVAANLTGTTQDRRFDTALAALSVMDLATTEDDGQVTLATQCPWPDAEVLIDLLSSTQPGAADELQAALHAMTTDSAPPNTGIETLRRAALAVIDAVPGSMGRVAFVGRIDPAVLSRLRAKADYLIVAAVDEDEANRLHLTLKERDWVHITTLDAICDDQLFDTVFGLAAAEHLSSSQQTRLTRLGAAGADLILVDTEVDLFELMTRRYRKDSALDQFGQGLDRHGMSCVRGSWADAPDAVFVSGTYPDVDIAAPLSVTVLGECALAMSLRDANPEGQAVVTILVLPDSDLADVALAQSDALRGIGTGKGTLWLVQSGLEKDETLRGWRRSLANETARDIRSMAIADNVDPEMIVQLATRSSEQELIVDKDSVRSPRIVPVKVGAHHGGSDCRLTLEQAEQGKIDTLIWARARRIAPKAGEVEVEVAATGLNYRDVMWAQGVLPAEMLEGGFSGPTFGMECAGIVTRVGPKAPFKPGDLVVAFAPSAFSSHVTVDAETVMALPPGTDLQVAASIPVVFVTADYALNELARLSPGEWVLIHGGAGGVGQAAVQIAKRAGAKIVATAGVPQKRALLAALGVDHILDSRSLDFVGDVQRITGGRGVDVVLNSLAGEAMEQSVSCLAPFGRFVELGKRDFLANTALGLRALKDNISYYGVDADQLLLHRPEIAKRVMERVIAGLSDNSLVALPTRIFPAEMVDDAFRLMQKSGHIGKIVVVPPDVSARATVVTAPDYSGSWLVTGGTGGFGLATAKWLAKQGAERFWLVSRSGTIAAKDHADLSALGARVEVVATDVSDAGQVSALMDRIANEDGELAGIVHSAAIFDDAIFSDIGHDRIASQLGVKLGGARLLDLASRSFSLNHFWMYSSVAARVGNHGQAAYVAANLGLEGIARRRRTEGLPGLAVAWGPIGDTGYLDRAEDLRAIMELKLGKAQTANEALEALGKALAHEPARTTLTIAPIDWSRLKVDLPVVSGRLFELLNLRVGASGLGADFDLAKIITDQGEAKARKAVLEFLLDEAAKIMRIAPRKIDVDRPLTELGFDSLMGISLKMTIEERMGAELPMAQIGDGLTLARMAHDLVEAAKSGESQTTAGMMAERHLTQTAVSESLRKEIMNVALGEKRESNDR